MHVEKLIGVIVGGRGSSSASSGIAPGAAAADYSRGAAIASELGVSEQRGAEMFDAINRWADGSTGIKNAQRGGKHTEQNAEDAATLEEFIAKSPSYQGELIRVMAVPDSARYRKNGKIHSDGSITSWTVPSNYANAKNGFGAQDKAGMKTVVYHVSATRGADTRRYSNLAAQDGEIIQSGGYESNLKISRVQTREEYDFWGGKEKVTHVYLEEQGA